MGGAFQWGDAGVEIGRSLSLSLSLSLSAGLGEASVSGSSPSRKPEARVISVGARRSAGSAVREGNPYSGRGRYPEVERGRIEAGHTGRGGRFGCNVRRVQASCRQAREYGSSAEGADRFRRFRFVPPDRGNGRASGQGAAISRIGGAGGIRIPGEAGIPR